MKRVSRTVGILARRVASTACLASVGLILAQPVAAQGIYTCVDSKGRKITADRPIPECTDREQKVLNPSGTVQKQVGPTLTAAERAAQEERDQVRREELARKEEEKRRERALLIRYPNQATHDKERSEAIDQIAAVRTAAHKRVAELHEQRKKLAEEMEFYKRDPSKAPPALRRQVDEVAQSLVVQDRFIRSQDDEVKRVNARFDEELVRLKDLWKLRTSVSAGAATPAAASPQAPGQATSGAPKK